VSPVSPFVEAGGRLRQVEPGQVGLGEEKLGENEELSAEEGWGGGAGWAAGESVEEERAWEDVLLEEEFVPAPVESPGGRRVQDKRAPAERDLVTIRGYRGKQVRLHRLAADALTAMTRAARAAGLGAPLLEVVSGYRTPEHQQRLWERALRKYGSEKAASRWVARPGHSAHGSGRAVDLWLGIGPGSENVARMRGNAAHRWLIANAARFGFYPYEQEPWHWEYNPPATGAVAPAVPAVVQASAPPPVGATAPTLDDFVAIALTQRGDPYVFGAESRFNDPNPAAFDCSELVQWAAARAGVRFVDGAQRQRDACRLAGTLIPLPEALQTRGALLFRIDERPGNDHVAISLGDGTTIEAKGRTYGVNVFRADDRPWTHAGIIPGFHWTRGAPPAPPPPRPPTPGERLLRLGTRGEDVRWVQRRLQMHGFDTGAADGIFGRRTEAAVRGFQHARGLDIDGVVGRRTVQALSQAT
jgi:cell wall-associated NlpC family hydrolase